LEGEGEADLENPVDAENENAGADVVGAEEAEEEEKPVEEEQEKEAEEEEEESSCCCSIAERFFANFCALLALLTCNVFCACARLRATCRCMLCAEPGLRLCFACCFFGTLAVIVGAVVVDAGGRS